MIRVILQIISLLIIYTFSANYALPIVHGYVKKETIKRLKKGMPSLEKFANGMTKSKKRYEDKMYQYYLHSELNGVFYIYKNKSILNRLQAAEERFLERYAAKIYYASLKDIQSTNGKVSFEKQDRKKPSHRVFM